MASVLKVTSSPFETLRRRGGAIASVWDIGLRPYLVSLSPGIQSARIGPSTLSAETLFNWIDLPLLWPKWLNVLAFS